MTVVPSLAELTRSDVAALAASAGESQGSVPPMALSAADVARELGLSLRQVRRMDDAGRLPRPVRIGRLVRWRRAELEAWLAAGCPLRDEWSWRASA
jgi:excisionase family DNA binding protein